MECSNTFSSPSPRNSNSVGLGGAPEAEFLTRTLRRFPRPDIEIQCYMSLCCSLGIGMPSEAQWPWAKADCFQRPVTNKLSGHCSATALRQNASVFWGSSRVAINPLLLAGMPFTQGVACLPFSVPQTSCHPFWWLGLPQRWPKPTLKPPLLGLLHWVHFTGLCTSVAKPRLLFCPVINCSYSEIFHSNAPLHSRAPSTQCLVSSIPLAFYISMFPAYVDHSCSEE